MPAPAGGTSWPRSRVSGGGACGAPVLPAAETQPASVVSSPMPEEDGRPSRRWGRERARFLQRECEEVEEG